MSLRYLYRTLAPEERICPSCGKPILRNIAVYEGDLWHYGCLQEAKRVKWRCRSCYAQLSTLQTIRATVGDQVIRACTRCGGQVEPLYTWAPPQVNVIPEGST